MTISHWEERVVFPVGFGIVSPITKYAPKVNHTTFIAVFCPCTFSYCYQLGFKPFLNVVEYDIKLIILFPEVSKLLNKTWTGLLPFVQLTDWYLFPFLLIVVVVSYTYRWNYPKRLNIAIGIKLSKFHDPLKCLNRIITTLVQAFGRELLREYDFLIWSDRSQFPEH